MKHKQTVKSKIFDVIANGPYAIRFVDIQKIIVELSGKEYKRSVDRGQYSSAIRTYFQKPGIRDKRFLVKGADGLYRLSV